MYGGRMTRHMLRSEYPEVYPRDPRCVDPMCRRSVLRTGFSPGDAPPTATTAVRVVSPAGRTARER
ncbi:hypothetical protein J2853_008802 [Streptosporangium lutulentum]|uniref:Uncharacterized protein n=1 Tax=Streptosporangium lutulentum TaxID=1461250 RepID=A0ABT9QT61_9ACTN|nr:hypothetical protein [Streptosporangium lutulentum]